MRLDRSLAERSLVEVVDPLNGDRLVGLGFRLLDGAIATSCRCLPRPRGEVVFPDPDLPGVLVLVRLRLPGTSQAASGIVTAADPCSGLALLEGATAAGLTVPDELNPILPIGQLIAQLRPAAPALAPGEGEHLSVCTEERAWVECGAGPSTLAVEGPGRLGCATIGAPAFDEEGRVVGLVASVAEDGRAGGLCRLSEHLPGWALREAAAAAHARHGQEA
jgi:hypothetical protein